MEFPGFPAPAAYAAYTGRSYSNFPGFGLAGGIAGYPTGFHGYGFFQPTAAAQSSNGAGVITQDRTQPGGPSYYDFTQGSAQGHVSRTETGTTLLSRESLSFGRGTSDLIAAPLTTQLTAGTTTPALVAQALSAMAIKDQILPLVNSFHSGPGPQTFGSTSPASRSFQQPNSPGPNNHDPYVDHGYGQTTSPQPSGIQVNVNRAPLIAAAFANGYH